MLCIALVWRQHSEDSAVSSPPSSSCADAEADAFTIQVNESSSLLHGSVPNTDYRQCDQEHDRLLFFASERVRDLRVVLIARG